MRLYWAMASISWAFSGAIFGVADAADKPAYTLKATENAPPMELSKEVRAQLEARSFQVLDAEGKVYCEVWFCKQVPATADEEQIKNGLTYQELEPSTLIGVIQFHQKGKDYRDQEVRAGVYTLRLASQPQDGDHMGTAPYAEFCLLVWAADDAKPGPVEIKTLYEMSAKTAGGSHPIPLLLFPNHKPEAEAKLVDKGMNHWVLMRKLEVSVGGKKTSIGIGLTVVGKSAQAG